MEHECLGDGNCEVEVSLKRSQCGHTSVDGNCCEDYNKCEPSGPEEGECCQNK